jgi:hypothetical protein
MKKGKKEKGREEWSTIRENVKITHSYSLELKRTF